MAHASLRLLTIVAFAALVGCTKQEDDDSSGGGPDTGAQLSGRCTVSKIFNGESCPKALGPVVLLIGTTETNQAKYQCTGTFITKKHILTAGHCNPKGKAGAMYAVTNDAFNPNNVTGLKVASFDPHPRYLGALSLGGYDVGVITLERSAAGATTLPIIASQKVKIGQSAYLLGFGLEENQRPSFVNGKSPLAPESAKVTVADVNRSTILFGDKKRGACPGDSGGPAVIAGPQGVNGIVGVTSGGYSADCRQATLSHQEFEQLAQGRYSPTQIEFIKTQFPSGIPQDFYTNLQSDAVLNFVMEIAPETKVL